MNQTRKDSPQPDVVRLSVNLSPDVADALKNYAARKGTTITEAVRRAVSYLAFFEKETDAGGEILVRSQKGQVDQVKFL